MSSGTVKRQLAAAKRENPSTKDRQSSKAVASSIGANRVGERDITSSPLSSRPSSEVLNAEKPVARPRPKPVPRRPVKAVNTGGNIIEDLLELTSSEEDGHDVDETSMIVDGSTRPESDSDLTPVVKVESSIRTRSSNGISKKRYLKDAAILSDDEEFPVHITPKKSRLSSRKNMFYSVTEGYDAPSDADVDGRDDLFAVEDASLSLSPLKLVNSEGLDIQDGAASDVELVDEDDPFLESPIDKRSKTKGKKKANNTLSAREEILSDDERLHPEEKASLAKALEESRRALVTRTEKLGGSSSSFGVDQAKVSTAGRVRRSFKDVIPQPPTTPLMSNGAVLYDDTQKYRVSSLPAACEVSNASLQDPYLAKDYTKLPPLKAGTLKSWNATAASPGMSLVNFSEWAVQCPNMDFDAACDAIRFARYKNFINPSRISPLDVNILYTTHDRKRSVLQCNFKTAICLTPVLSRDSYLVNPTTSGLRNKYLSGHPHRQEWQRLEGFACMVFDKPVMVAQIHKEAISFMTMGSFKDREATSSPSKQPRNPSILSSSVKSSAAANKHKTLKADSHFKSVLDHSDEVPVYDAREVPFNFASDLEDVASALPRFHGEIPVHSFVVVGYTLGHYEKDGRPYLTTNILFAILLGTE
ncbi:hypothetical protein BDZ97DRAFT_1912054 [Flammula alnicola]|nr:hypothetical protein BDZ97DRAFT_1912054 [Flammula alnicola]